MSLDVDICSPFQESGPVQAAMDDLHNYGGDVAIGTVVFFLKVCAWIHVKSQLGTPFRRSSS